MKTVALQKKDPALCSLKGSELSSAVSKHKVAFINEELKRLYEQESDAVKSKVEIYRKKGVEECKADRIER